MKVSSKQVEQSLESSRIAFENAKNRQDIKDKLATFNYDDRRLDDGLAIWTQTNEKYHAQRLLYGESMELTKQFNEKFEAEKTRYMDYRKLSKRAFVGKSDAGIPEIIRVNQQVKKTIQGFLIQARDFYRNVLKRPDIMEKVSIFGLNDVKMQEGLAGLEELERLNVRQKEKQGGAERATRVRDDAFKELNACYYDFVEACKIALRDSPQLREVLGILERSAPKKKKKEEAPVANPTPVLFDNSGMGE